MMTPETAFNSQGMFKNSSPNKKLTIYLESRDYVVDNGSADKIQGVIHVESAELKNMKLLGQVTMIFRYGRDDKEVMGVESCNETIVSLTQIWPPYYQVKQPISAFQETLIKRLGDYAFPFYLKITHLAPPSIKLVPAKQYYGAPMGTSYDVRAYMEDSSRSNTVRMGIRLFQGRRRPQPRLFPPHAPHPTLNALVWLPQQPFRLNEESELLEVQSIRDKKPIVKVELGAPCGKIEGPFLLSDGRVEMEVMLDKATYCHGELIKVNTYITNHSSKIIEQTKFQVIVIQHIDVCMNSNGKFKNVVAFKQEYGKPIRPEKAHHYINKVRPHRGVIKEWIALQDSYSETGATLASTFPCNSDTNVNERNVFAIDVSYYVKVKLTHSEIDGTVSVKLPFTLTRSCID